MADILQLPAGLIELLAATAQPTAVPVGRSTVATMGTPAQIQERTTIRTTSLTARDPTVLEAARPDSQRRAVSSRGAARARRLVDIFANENITSATGASAGATTSASTSTSAFGSLSVILPTPTAGSIAGICVGASFMLFGILFLWCRRRLDFRGNRLARDSESGPEVLEVAVGGKPVVDEGEKVLRKPPPAKHRGTADERRWRQEIRLELEAEVVDLKRKEKEYMLRHTDICSM